MKTPFLLLLSLSLAPTAFARGACLLGSQTIRLVDDDESGNVTLKKVKSEDIRARRLPKPLKELVTQAFASTYLAKGVRAEDLEIAAEKAFDSQLGEVSTVLLDGKSHTVRVVSFFPGFPNSTNEVGLIFDESGNAVASIRRGSIERCTLR